VRAKNTDKVYGSYNGELEWGFSYSGKSEPKIKYGYIFIDRKTPYYTLSLTSAQNTGSQVDAVQSDDNSPPMILYFTRNQAGSWPRCCSREPGRAPQGTGIRDYSEEGDVYEN
jgi:hypothetical protein